MANNGKTLKIDLRNALASLTLNAKRRYILDHVHFHWGSENSVGSEHHFDGRSFPAEVSQTFKQNIVVCTIARIIKPQFDEQFSLTSFS